ncbi:MAG: cysteine--tRNA ligase [Candidatus Eisenbacteria bacterium]|nr:cysteine--tRNA ligase [Candidatus Eisenbacteria bacterium]
MLRIYDTLEGRKKEFVPVREGKVGMYFCGMTVQSEPHVGHMRVAVVSDLFKRYLRYKGYDVTLVINFTDIDDKIIEKAGEEGVDYLEIAQRNIDKFMEFLHFLGAEEADHYPRATEFVGEIIKLVERLVERGYAYESGGDVYFEVKKWKNYGKLSKRNLEDLLAGASQRVALDDKKRNPEDFAVWKAAKEGEPAWESPWGMGRPGWHIECSAMSTKYLGEHFDIHGGGTELIFPHHENEMAQSEAATGKPYVNHWVHHGLVNLVGEKMSKSTGHFKTMEEIAAKFPPDVVRFYLLSTHYRTQIEFSDERLEEAASSIERFENLFRTLDRVVGPEGQGDEGAEPSAAMEEERAKFIEAMDDDLNTAQAMGHLFEAVRVLNQEIESGASAEVLRADRRTLRGLLDILGLLKDLETAGEDAPEEVEKLVAARTDARAARDWARADELRAEIEAAGYTVEDTPDGPVVRKAR